MTPSSQSFFYVAARFQPAEPALARMSDYRALLAVIERAFAAHPVRLVAYCALPGHWELAVGPTTPHGAESLAQWVIDTHATEHRGGKRSGTPRALYASPTLIGRVSSPENLVYVCRSIERRAVQAGLSRHAQDWPWSSLSERFRCLKRVPLVSSPFLTSNWWVSHVNNPQVDVPRSTGPSSGSHDLTQTPRRLAGISETLYETLRMARIGHENQAHSHVERTEHLRVRDAAGGLQPREQGRNHPAVTVE